jgi:hypothetical protein
MRRTTRWMGLFGASALSPAWAHEIPGLPGSHWHATDTLGILLAALVAVGAWLWWRGPR